MQSCNKIYTSLHCYFIRSLRNYEYNMSEEISKRQPHKCKVVTKFKIASKKGEIRRSNDETDATTESTHLKKA